MLYSMACVPVTNNTGNFGDAIDHVYNLKWENCLKLTQPDGYHWVITGFLNPN